MAHERAIAAAFDGLWGKSSERNLIRGRLGLPGGGTPVFDVPDRPGYKYVNKGAAGELGQVIARDAIGVANTYNQNVWMRYEFGEYVIGRADSVAGGGGGSGATNLDALTDVTLTTPANGNTLAYNSSTGQWVNVVPAGGAGGAPSPHPLAISGGHHTPGILLPWTDLNKSGSSLADLGTRSHSMLTGIAPDDHHAQQHVLASGTALGADHTISGAAPGEVLRALSATTAAFDVLQHTDLGNILPDQHHTRAHDIITGDASGAVHTIVGSQFQVVGATAANVLGLLTPAFAPGAAAAILRTDANGGIQLDTNLLYVDGANNRIGVNVVPGAGLKGGAAALDIRAATTGDITQRIRQLSGQTQRLWRIEDVNGDELIVLDSVGNLQSGQPGFTSGQTGWQITPQGNAEFNNIWARGELHATVFVKDEVHATGGTFMVATAGTLHDEATISSSTVDDDVLTVYSTPAGQGVPLQVVTTSGTFVGTELHVSWIGNFINVNDPPSGPGTIGGPGPYFQPGDIIRSKTEVPTGVTDFWLEVNGSVQTSSGYATYSVVKRSGTDGKLPKGAALVSYGKEGDGRILMTSDLNYAPYIDVFTTGTNVWLGAAGSVVPRMRMGRLDGIGLPGVSGIEQYGMIAGKDLSDANSGYLIASNLQFSLYKVDIRLNNGVSDTGLWTAAGSLKLGSNIGSAVTTGFQFDQSTGDVIIGNPAGTPADYLRWNQASGVLIVSGSLLVTDPGGTVTLAEVNALDNIVRTDAGLSSSGYAGQARDIATAYADARRIVGVTGSWDSPTATTIRWGTKAVAGTPAGVAMGAAFGSGGSRVIANHAAASISVTSRMYMFVDVSVPPPSQLTMTATPSLATVMASVNNVLIAVADPGDATTKACSITVVAGSTYISGSNIFTGSIVAANIAAGTITANKLDAGTLNATYLDPISSSAAAAQTTANTANTAAGTAQSTANSANTAAGTAQTTANTANTAAGNAQTAANAAQADADAAALAAATNKTYSDARRILAVSGNWSASNGNTITWTGLQARFASGGSRTITSQLNVVLSPGGRWYLYVDVSGTGTMAMETPTQSLASLGVNHVLIAVVDTMTGGPTPMASITVVAGSTYISGGNIMTGSIVATNIATTTITADRMNIDYLGGMSSGIVRTGILEMDTFSNIHSAGKAYNNGVAGVFLGWDTATPARYKFDVGSSAAGLLWDGANLTLTTNQSITVNNTSTGQILSMSGPGASTGLLALNSAGVLTFTGSGAHFNANRISADKLIVTAGTFQIEEPRLDIIHNTSAGAVGDMAWSVTGSGGGEQVYFYICYAANRWVRMLFPLTTW